MYPSRDFRSLLKLKNNISQDQIIRSICREPFPEVLRYWEKTNKPNDLYYLYAIGIEEAVAKDRYPLYQLKEVLRLPEFIEPVVRGLKRLWLKCPCTIIHDDESIALIIDSTHPNTIKISEEDRLKMLKMNLNQANLDFFINGVNYKIKLLPSKRAHEIHEFLSMF